MTRHACQRRTARAFVSAGWLLAATLLLAPVAGAQERPAQQERLIAVTGTGAATATPDLAVTQLTVLRTAPTAGAALAEANAAMTEVIGALKGLGIKPRDLQTGGFQISPQYRYDTAQDGTQGPPTLVGYDVRNTLSVRIRDLAAVGTVLDKAVSLGVNEGNGVQFTIDDPAPLRGEARKKAVAEATATASALAAAAGVTLGEVVSIDVSPEPMPPIGLPLARMSLSGMAKSEDGVPVEAGENSVSASVRVVFRIAGGS